MRSRFYSKSSQPLFFSLGRFCLQKQECSGSLSNLQCDSHTGGLMQMPAVMCPTQTHDVLCLPRGSGGTENGGKNVRKIRNALVHSTASCKDGSGAPSTPSAPSSALAAASHHFSQGACSRHCRTLWLQHGALTNLSLETAPASARRGCRVPLWVKCVSRLHQVAFMMKPMSQGHCSHTLKIPVPFEHQRECSLPPATTISSSSDGMWLPN